MSRKFKAPDVMQPKVIVIHGVEYVEKQQLLTYIRTGAKVILANLAGKPESQRILGETMAAAIDGIGDYIEQLK